jgi:hypothetical protein
MGCVTAATQNGFSQAGLTLLLPRIVTFASLHGRGMWIMWCMVDRGRVGPFHTGSQRGIQRLFASGCNPKNARRVIHALLVNCEP